MYALTVEVARGTFGLALLPQSVAFILQFESPTLGEESSTLISSLISILLKVQDLMSPTHYLFEKVVLLLINLS